MIKSDEILFWQNIEKETGISNVGFHRLANGTSTSLHTHDFPEFFWGVTGRGTHEINGRKEKILPSELWFIHPDDVHRIRANSGSFSFYNLAFPMVVLTEMQQRYNSRILPLWLDPSRKASLHFHLQPALFQWLNASLKELFMHKNSRLHLEHFLIHLLVELEEEQSALTEDTPDWILQLCQDVKSPDTFLKTNGDIIKNIGYSYEHLTRELKKYTGKTLTELINSAKIEYAALQLCVTSYSIDQIAMLCGFQYPAYFFTLFKRHFGCSPKQYRDRNLRFNIMPH